METSEIRYAEVPGWPGYRAGDDGSVWSRRTAGGTIGATWRKLAAGRGQRGYRKVILSVNGARRHVKACIVVLEAFVGPKPTGMIACHRNDIRDDDRLANLRWATIESNARDAARNGRLGAESGKRKYKLDPDRVERIRNLHAAGHSYSEIAAVVGISKPTVCQVITGKTWRHVT